MVITETSLKALKSGCKAADLAPLLTTACAAHDIDTPRRARTFIATLCVESGGLRVFEESLNYDWTGLKATFKSRATPACEKLCRIPGRKADQAALANILYGGAWGKTNLGNTQPEDGWRFRGRGPGQVTGRTHYQTLKTKTGIDFIAEPETLADPKVGFNASAILWSKLDMNAKADAGSPTAIRKAWNGGTVGLAEFKTWLAKVEAIWP